MHCDISADKLQARIGQEYLILFDEVNDLGIVGRSYMDALEIDGKGIYPMILMQNQPIKCEYK